MKLSTKSLFESEMVEQVQAAEAAVRKAEGRDDAASADAARSHLDNLLSLARRNGLSITSELSGTPTAIPDSVVSMIDISDPGAAPAVAPAV